MVTDITQFSNEAKETWKWVNTAKILIELIMVPSKKRKCAVPPDLFHSEISFSSTCHIPNHCLSKKTKRYLKLMRIYFVFSEDLILILTFQKVCNWFRIRLTKISMLTKTNICLDWNYLMGNNGANWIPATGGRSSKRTILWLHTWEITFAQRRCPNFHTLCIIAMRKIKENKNDGMCVVVLLLLKNKFQHGAFLFVDLATSPDRSEQSFQAECSNFAQMKISIKLCINKLSDVAGKSKL